jgi:translation initiation factor IF-1
LKREETLKKIRETAKAGVDASQDPEIMAKLEKRMQSAEIKMRAEDEVS